MPMADLFLEIKAMNQEVEEENKAHEQMQAQMRLKYGRR